MNDLCKENIIFLQQYIWLSKNIKTNCPVQNLLPEQKILLLSLLRERKHIYTFLCKKKVDFSGLCKVLCLLHLCFSPLHFSALITFSPYCNQPKQTLLAQHDTSANSCPDTFTLTHWLVKGHHVKFSDHCCWHGYPVMYYGRDVWTLLMY